MTHNTAYSAKAAVLDPLTIPLMGLQLIEASAGTGKSWTLAALYLRAVIERKLNPPQILVMTFTEAATAELRGSIRARLAQAAEAFSRGIAADSFLLALLERIPQQEWDDCAGRLDIAAQWMDEAAIFTIHGWSSRMLRQHALDSASLFDQARVEDSHALQLAAVRDYWRKWFYPLSAKQLEALDKFPSAPEALLKRLANHWRIAERRPDAPQFSGPSPHELIAQWEEWRDALERFESRAKLLWSRHREALHLQLLSAMAVDLNGQTYKKESHEAYLAQIDAWSEGQLDRDPVNLKRFSLSTLHAKTNKSRTKPVDAFGAFAAMDALVQHLDAPPQVVAGIGAHAAWEAGAQYQRRKHELAQFDFSDLVQRLFHALHQGDARLASAIRQQYPMALVDEFQDTDPWQYGALSRIYAHARLNEDAAAALVMIGDPKQAIYGFRGADLATYLRARTDAHRVYTLDGNYRSTQEMVNAVNHVFLTARCPFGDVGFDTVSARNANVKPLLLPNARQTAMTVWHLGDAGALNKKTYQWQMSEVFASHMVQLLNSAQAVAGDMAVLVRSWDEARSIRQALNARGVRSVYLSERDSVYATEEARDLWRLLRAVAQPRSASLLRAALATRLWGVPWGQIQELMVQEDAWDVLVEDMHRWQRTWLQQGVLPMMHQWMHDQDVPARLAAVGDPERRLTNLLHLGDLLQQASLSLQGEHALARFLEEQLVQAGEGRAGGSDGETHQLRLESDADLVQVVTMHKSKGLEYPFVFLPFVSNFRDEDADSGRTDEERIAEDIRLFYVALTRAQRAVWLGVAHRSLEFPKKAVAGKTPGKSAVSRLLGRADADDLVERLVSWSTCPDIDVRQAPAPDLIRFAGMGPAHDLEAACVASRRLRSDWWQASFSALVRKNANVIPTTSSRDERRADAYIDAHEEAQEPADEQASEVESATSGRVKVLPVLAYNAFPAGSRYGTLLHDLLEWQALNGWPAAMRLPPEPAHTITEKSRPAREAEWQRLLELQCQLTGLTSAARALLEQWIGVILTAELPHANGATGLSTALVLAQLDSAEIWPEMAFALPALGIRTAVIDAEIARHVLPGRSRPPLDDRFLNGMLTGLMDLVYEHEGRYFVLDYKSNKLEAYSAGDLQSSMLAHRYDVQASLYLLALHRLLKSRLSVYDYDTHMGGAVHVFLRGIEAPGAGVFITCPSRTMIETLDEMFAGQRTSQATAS